VENDNRLLCLAGFSAREKLYLCLEDWIDCATPAPIWAAHQAGIAMQP
jgi:hypothetical protein